MLTHALALLDDLETAIVGEECQPDRTFVAAGEPASPNPGCIDMAVWVSNVQDGNLDPNSCMVRSELQLSYRIGWCYTDKPEGPSEDDELTAATCLYDLMEAVWCYLVEVHSQGTIAGTDKCDQSSLGPLVVNPRSGGWVEAVGTITIQYNCAIPS